MAQQKGGGGRLFCEGDGPLNLGCRLDTLTRIFLGIPKRLATAGHTFAPKLTFCC